MADRDPVGDARWRAVLTGNYQDNQFLARTRPLFRWLPSEPRCRVCAAPYGPPFGPIMKALGFGPWDRNPAMCGACLGRMERHLGGADVELTLLFADLRGSTELAGRMTPTAYRSMVNDFYAVATRDIEVSGGIVNKYLGDGVFAIFVPGFSGSDHARRAIEAAQQILRDTEADGPLQPLAIPLAVGIGLHTGTAYVGVMGRAGHLLDFTALGDAVNLAERLSSAAAAREILISADAVRAAGSGTAGLTRRELRLKGIDQPVAAWSDQHR